MVFTVVRIFTVRLGSLYIDLVLRESAPVSHDSRRSGRRFLMEPMRKCIQNRPQQKQAQIEQYGPYSSIVLAVP